jgi:hypothetical protein
MCKASSVRWARALILRGWLWRVGPGRSASYGRHLMCKHSDIAGAETPELLAPLAIGDELPWRRRWDGELQWLVVVELIDGSSCRVRYPNGTTGVLVDSE